MYRRLIQSLAPLCFIWFGIVVGISVIEAPAKFKAPSLTREVGLDVGRIVFGVLNKTEIVIYVLVVLLAVFRRQTKYIWTGVGLLGVILLMQSAWLLPDLSARTDLILAGETPEASHTHALYAALELVKLIVLMLVGFLSLRELVRQAEHR